MTWPTRVTGEDLSGRTGKDKIDWVLEFSRVNHSISPPDTGKAMGEGITISPPDTGKAMGEGITIFHPDTGYTLHPELLEGERISINRTLDRDFDIDFFSHYANVIFGRHTYTTHLSAEDRLDGWSASHGTKVASILMSGIGHPNDPHTSPIKYVSYTEAHDKYVTGIAPKAKLIPSKVTSFVMLSDSGEAALARSIYYAIKLSIKEPIGVISISLGNPDTIWTNSSLETALLAAKNEGIIVCAAGGQLGHEEAIIGIPIEYSHWLLSKKNPAFPGGSEYTIGCGACDINSNMIIHGMEGSQIDITAPGVFPWKAVTEDPLTPVYSVTNDSSGTSYATAVVAGVCALWQAHHGRDCLITKYGKERLFDVFKTLLQSTADVPNEWDTENHGAGIINATKLLNETLP